VLLHAVWSGPSATLRRGVLALGALGLLTIADGALPLSCAEGLDPTCEIEGDAIDVLHGIETNLATVAALVAFWLLGRGLRAEPGQRAAATTTLVLGIAWLALSIALLAGAYPLDDPGAGTGTIHRASQLVLGAWFVLLGWAGSRPSADLR
jgi:hypothetical protein